MRGSAKSMTFHRPRTPEQAVRLGEKFPGATPLAGGTDFMVLWNAGLLDGRTIIDLSALPWTDIKRSGSGLSIGALCTHAQMRENPHVRAGYSLLAESCATVGGEQIQNQGTLGGNIANASPAGDTFPPLAVYEAEIQTLGPAGARTVAFDEIFAGVKKTTLRPAELIESVCLPELRKPSRQMFRKVGTRAAQAISKVSAAGLLWLNSDGTVAELRFALGSVAPTVRRLRAAESFLAGKRLSKAHIDGACDLVLRDISPIDDIRSTREYRAEVSQNLLRSFLES